MSNLLEKLTKEDLIIVVAKLSDGENWSDFGYGWSKEDGEKLNTIAALCLNYCSKNDNWELPNIEND